jgi:hypothetical protein
MILLQDLKIFLKITDDTKDVFLQDCIDKATAVINLMTNRKLDFATNTEYYFGNGEDEMYIHNSPVDSVTSIKIYNKNGDYTFVTIFDGSDNIENSLLLLPETGKLILKKGYVFTHYALLEIIYVSGYKANGTGLFLTPDDLQIAVLKLAAKHYLESYLGDSIFLKQAINIGGAATTGVTYKDLDVSDIVMKYRRINF